MCGWSKGHISAARLDNIVTQFAPEPLLKHLIMKMSEVS